MENFANGTRYGIVPLGDKLSSGHTIWQNRMFDLFRSRNILSHAIVNDVEKLLEFRKQHKSKEDRARRKRDKLAQHLIIQHVDRKYLSKLENLTAFGMFAVLYGLANMQKYLSEGISALGSPKKSNFHSFAIMSYTEFVKDIPQKDYSPPVVVPSSSTSSEPAAESSSSPSKKSSSYSPSKKPSPSRRRRRTSSSSSSDQSSFYDYDIRNRMVEGKSDSDESIPMAAATVRVNERKEKKEKEEKEETIKFPA